MQADGTIEAGVATEARWLPSLPLVLLGAAVLICALLLTQPLTLPLGPMYWDLVLYLDAANRIGDGQVPLIDFIAPVGPLGYWLFAGFDALFPRAHPLLLAQWCLFAVTAPAMAVILHTVGRQSRARAMALLLPYLAFQILPINVEHYSFFPGTDGFGIYNRHVSIVLYVLVCGLLFLRGPALAAIIGWTLIALFMIKITGFLAGGLVTAFALAAGRIGLRQALTVAAAAGLALIGFELATGLVSAYLGSILALIAINAGGILPRFVQAASLHLDIVGAGAALVLALFWLDRRDIADTALALRRQPSAAGFIRLLDRDVAWLAVVLAAGLFFETQNTGGQAFIFIWPVLLMILSRWLGSGRRGALVVCGLVAATAIPPAETVLQRGARALMAQAGYAALPNQHLGRLGQVSQHADVMNRASAMLDIYAAHPATFREFTAREMLPSPQLYSELDFQASWLMAVDEGVAAILAHERASGRRFETIMSLNFVNPFPAVMGRSAPRGIAIGADPFRAVPKPDDAEITLAREADLVLYPLCPVTVANEALRKIYAPVLTGRREIALGRCWKGYVKAG
ncbi:hypothetical protein [Bosea robiniae]|uniref:Glycosyltransferase RgtA/B/C/D-like domain-containing protein n=1 Tax=Bosea robiniae TaxID=1036780 RepID=A0ABY0P0I7_9HYPH|nr:hypothetical protein [Bosea robiniae]SDG56204.1 hypothetical protein SAMN05421844_104353 [Bosea robiniae]